MSDVLAKSIVHRMLEPAFRLKENVRVICRENRSAEAFMGDLAVHAVDVLLSDAPAGPGTSVRAFSHPLGECGLGVLRGAFARQVLADVDFPRSLDGVPFLLPGSDSTFRRALNEWFDSRNIRPKVIAELDDAALATDLRGGGARRLRSARCVEKEIRQRYKVQVVGRAKEIRQRFYAISVERKIRHPAVVAICEVARKHIFA